MADEKQVTLGFEPLHDAHAIEQVVFAIQFERPLETSALNATYETLDTFAKDLPAKVDLQPMFSVAFGNPSTPMPPPPVAGKIRQNVRPDRSVGAELKVDHTSIFFRTTQYSRWAGTWAEAKRYCDAFLPTYVSNSKIVGVSLNYVDKFIWAGALEKCRPSDLLNTQSKYLCAHIYDSLDLWHSHTGAFQRVDSQTKRLFNVNVDCNDEAKDRDVRRIVSVTTVISDLLNQPGYEPIALEAGTSANYLDAKMQGLHAFGKMLFSNVINERMGKRIALTI